MVPRETTIYSGAPAARRAAKRSPILIWETKGKVDFLMVIMASGIARGRVRTTATESRNMAAILQIMGWQRHVALVYCVLLWYWTSMLWSIDTSLTWPYRGLKFIAHRGQVFFEVDRWPKSRAHVGLTCWKKGRIVRKPVNANPGFKPWSNWFTPNYHQLSPTIVQIVKRPKKFVIVDDSSPAVAQAKSREQRIPSSFRVKMWILNGVP